MTSESIRELSDGLRGDICFQHKCVAPKCLERRTIGRWLNQIDRAKAVQADVRSLREIPHVFQRNAALHGEIEQEPLRIAAGVGGASLRRKEKLPRLAATRGQAINAGLECARHLLERSADERRELAGDFDFEREFAAKISAQRIDGQCGIGILGDVTLNLG